MGEHRSSVYIVANPTRLLYTGMTGTLEVRIYQHKTKSIECFTNHWNTCRLAYYETYPDVHKAIAREKQLKGWRREKKIKLIESVNPNWHDLSDGWYDHLPEGQRPCPSTRPGAARPRSG